jgi:predicted GIY-YIG superfamily endonuclease
MKNKKPHGYWNNKENCLKESLKYTNPKELEKNNKWVYFICRNNKWIDEFFPSKRKTLSYGYWNDKENCLKEALKYKTKSELHKNCPSAYQAAKRNGWLDEIVSHMEVVGNLKNRGIYAFEFEDNSVYVGLTYNFNERYLAHQKYGTVYEYIKESGLKYNYIILTDYMDEKIASKEEGIWVNKYKKNGWIILNKNKTGTLGGPHLKWDYESCKKEALKHKNRIKFQEKCSRAYQISRENGWLNEFFGVLDRKPRGYWIKERCQEESLKYNTKSEFKKKSLTSFKSARKNGWLDEICSHMISGLI